MSLPDPLVRLIEELQRLLAARTGVKGRLLCRRDKPETWMEVYEPVAEDTEFLATLEAELERVRFAELLGTDLAISSAS